MKDVDKAVYEWLEKALAVLREEKPNDRSERDRRYAVTITKMETVQAYFKTFVLDEEDT